PAPPPAPEPPAPEPPAPEPTAPEPTVPEPTADATAAKLATLEERLQKVEDELAAAKDDNTFLEEKLAALLPVIGKLGGYLDVGFFATTGNGAGTRSDYASTYFPEYAGIVPGSWVFMGDPFSTAVNSRGEPADLGESRAIVFDPIDSQGKSTFLVNAVNLTLFGGIGKTGSTNISVDFVPRGRDVSAPGGLFLGDYLDVKLAYGEWKPELESFELSLQGGKFDSVLGFEYRSMESPDRLGITPSLACRYTCGRPIGIKARGRFLDTRLIANVAVTNGSHFTESFAFAGELDTNDMKTVAGRLSYVIEDKVEVGASGALGAQDVQPANDVYQWHVGADLHVDYKDVELTAEYVQGKARGDTTQAGAMSGAHCDLAPCIRYKSAYGLVGYRLTNMFVPYLRVDWRDALHRSGASFVYVSQLLRGTAGVRAEIGERVIWKLEGTTNRELGRIPRFPNDVLTTSLVIKY
ncbi:MAG: outer membrane beta-barrel protein, partial [Deltaproteobacteria bacterium]|nr:outer membrane beta-barrel protein [Deltaproteobacteria bacterium]MDQ3295147.1 porin [Myxococcota bacterium]